MASTSNEPRTRRQVAEEARRAALEGDWQRAIEINKELIQRDSRDTDSFNRLGRALLESQDFAGAYEAYSSALKSDPANLIARRNLQRLELVRQQGSSKSDSEEAEPHVTQFPRTSVFIEEVGKTWITELANPVEMVVLAGVYAGQSLDLVSKRNRLLVTLQDGTVLGEIEQNSAARIIELRKGGNKYEVYALGLSGASLRIIIREVYRDPKLSDRISFPRQISGTRGYLRDRDRLRQIDEADFLMDDSDIAEMESDSDAENDVSEEDEDDSDENGVSDSEDDGDDDE